MGDFRKKVSRYSTYPLWEFMTKLQQSYRLLNRRFPALPGEELLRKSDDFVQPFGHNKPWKVALLSKMVDPVTLEKYRSLLAVLEAGTAVDLRRNAAQQVPPAIFMVASQGGESDWREMAICSAQEGMLVLLHMDLPSASCSWVFYRPKKAAAYLPFVLEWVHQACVQWDCKVLLIQGISHCLSTKMVIQQMGRKGITAKLEEV